MAAGADERPAYDYIVVGSGAGGGPLAANLARAGWGVLLLEAGGDDEGDTYRVPAFHGLATEDAALRWDYFVRHYADPDRQRLDSKFVPERDGVWYPRAGTLGGCTAHNAMITVYPHNSGWDEIARATGDPSWRSDRMRTYFERLERCRYLRRPRAAPTNPLLAWLLGRLPWLARFFGNPTRHGFDGWLGTDLADPALALEDVQLPRIVLSAAKASLVEDLGRTLRRLEDLDLGDPKSFFDPNDWRVQVADTQGLWLTPLATDQGRRNGTREYIRWAQREAAGRLTVKTGALVARVLFDGDNAAVGVEYLEGRHLYRADPNAGPGPDTAEPKRVLAGMEVILCAGAFNSPQLLKLSGVGPRDELTGLGIPVRVDLAGVGENLQDRYEVGVISEMEADFALLRDCGFEAPGPGQEADPCFAAWQLGRGAYTTNGVVIGVIKRSRAERPEPDLYIFGLPGYFKGYYPGYSKDLERNKNYFTWAILKALTGNTAGRVRLRSADPRDTPAITFHYFDEGNDAAGDDLEAMVEGVEFARRLMSRARDAIKREVLPGEQVRTRDQIREFVRNEAWGHHASCSCKMGPPSDPLAVVDSSFRVYGTKHLRVVDASVFPRIPGFFIASAIYMISEKASEVILADAAR